MVLSDLLGRASSDDEAKADSRVYDRVRRPRTQSIVASSRVRGAILTGTGESGTEENAAQYVKEPGKLLRRWDFILDLDVKAHRGQALREMEVALLKEEVGKE